MAFAVHFMHNGAPMHFPLDVVEVPKVSSCLEINYKTLPELGTVPYG